MLLALLQTALAAPPADLDGLVALALERDPQAAAYGWDAIAARSRARVAGTPMDPQLMLGVEALGAPRDALDPTMGMVGVTQMFRGFGEGAAHASRSTTDATRAEADRERVAADLRTDLWQTAVRLWSSERELLLVDEQLRGAVAMRDVALARFAAGGSAGSMEGMPPMPPSSGSAMEMGPAAAAPRRAGGDGMPGMPGMEAGDDRPAVLVGTAEPMTPEPSMPTASPSAASGMAGLLDLDARISRVAADREALRVERDGELLVLALRVGDEAADAVAADPDAYLGADPVASPELRLAGADRDAALASLRVARRSRGPDFMVSVAERIMPEGMLGGTDVSVGISVPLWSAAASIDAARADAEAAESRVAAVTRDLEIAAARAQAALAAAEVRARVLEAEALPRSRMAWEASLASFSAGLPSSDVVRSWEGWTAVAREALAARREAMLLAASLARVQGAP